MTLLQPGPRADDADPAALLSALLGMADSLGAGVAVQGAEDRRLRYVNPAFAALFGSTPAGLTGRQPSEWLAAGLAVEFDRAETAALHAGAPCHDLHRLGEGLFRRSFRVTRQRVPGIEAQSQPLLCSVWIELPDEQAAFGAQLQREIDLVRREQREFALLAIETKQPAAEMPVQMATGDPVGQRLRSSVRIMDSVFRLSPQRHVVLLSGAGLATAHARAGALRQLCAEAWPGLGLSIGIASCPHTASEGEAIVEAAEQALRRALELGGDRVAVAAIRFDPVA